MDISQAGTVRDVDSIDVTAWPMRPLGQLIGLRLGRFQVVIAQSALDEIHRHGKSSPEVEICGVLVGDCRRDAMGPYLHVESAIRGTSATGKSTQVTFTAETWTQIQAEMDRNHPDRRILGWYHTHPGFGIFLSEMDVFIHENFFSLAWQPALVYDPHSGDEGIFIWRDGKTVRDQWLVEIDDPKLGTSNHQLTSSASSADHPPAYTKKTGQRLQTRLLLLLAFLLAFVAAWVWVTFN